MTDYWLDFIVQIIGTLIGAGVGFGLVMWWDREKEKIQNRQTQKDTLESIIEELKTTQELMDKSKEDLGINLQFDVPFTLPRFPVTLTPAFDSAVNSGNFALLSSELQRRLSLVYFLINKSNYIVNQIHAYNLALLSDLRTSTIEKSTLEWRIDIHRTLEKSLQETYDVEKKEIDNLLVMLKNNKKLDGRL